MAQTTIQISHLTALASGLATTDEILVSDAGVTKRMDISVLEIAATQITASGTLPALNGAALTALTAANITASGTLPALNGAALTALTAANLTGALPAISGANLTNLPASGATLSGSTNNTVVTVTGSDAMIGEAGLTFDASAPTLKIRGESGAPATSGTTELAVLRLNPTGVTGTIDMGFHADSTGRAWIQATDTGNLGTGYNLHLNPNGGNVGIGMGTNPAARLLHLYKGASGVTSRASALLVLEDDTADEIAIQFLMPSGASTSRQQSIFFGDARDGTRGSIIYDQGDDAMRFGCGGFTRMTLDTDGRLGLGASVPTDTMIKAAWSTQSWVFNFTNKHGSGSNHVGQLNFSDSSPDGAGNIFLYCADSTTSRIIIYSDGDILNHDGTYGQMSDERIKQDIRDANSQWDDVKAIRVRNFKRKDDVFQYGERAWEHIGTIAQEVELISPKLVSEKPPTLFEMSQLGMGTEVENGEGETKWIPNVDEDGNEVTIKSMKYSILYMKAFKALQEAMARIEILETKVDALTE